MTANGVSVVALRDFMDLLAPPLPCLAPGVRAVVDPHLLAALAAMLSADVVVFNDMVPRQRLAWAQSVSFGIDSELNETADYEDREGGEEPEFFEVFWSDPCSHPERTGDFESVTTTSDFRSLREWRGSRMYHLFREHDVPIFDRSILLPLPAPPGRSRRVRFLRESGRDFDDTDRALATLVRPHLVAHLHALDLAHRGVAPLTRRQRHLMALVGQGYTNNQIARTSGISAQTVRTHLQQIYARLDE